MERGRLEEPITSQDIIFQILLRLPPRSLARFKIACKQWNSIISDDLAFEELHRKTQIQKLRLLFRTSPSSKPLSIQNFWICKLQDDKTKIEKLQQLQFRDGDRFSYLIDSLGALLLLKFEDKNHMAPKTLVYDYNNGNQMVLPCLPSIVKVIYKEFLVYDSSSNMHKVLAYTSVSNDKECFYITSFSMKDMATKTRWRMIPSPFENFYFTLSKKIIRSLLYWFVSTPLSIHLFDIVEEKFLNTIKCPDQMFTYAPYGNHLLEFKGSLGLILTSIWEFKIWVLKDSTSRSWIVLHKICLQAIFNSPFLLHRYIFRPIFILENLKALPSILFLYENKHYWYDMNDEERKEIDVLQLSANGHRLATWFS